MDDPVTPPIKRRRRWPAMLSVLLLIFLVVFGYLWFGLPPNVPAGPIRLVRGENGQMVPTPSPVQTGLISSKDQATKIHADNRLTSRASSTRSNWAGFSCDRVVIFNRSSHLLMARIGASLRNELKSLNYIREIEYYPAGFGPEQKLAPDVTIFIDMDQLVESGWPISHTVEATFTIMAGNISPGCHNSHSDRLDPPRIQFKWTGILHHTSTTTGVTSSSAKYKLVAESVARKLAEALAKEFAGYREKYGEALEMPQPFFPPYRELPALPLAELGNLELITTWHGLMNHNETLWRLAIDRPPTDVLTEMRRRLEADGWKLSDSSKSPAQDYMRLKRNGAILLAYAPSSLVTPPGPPPKGSVLLIQYVDRMTQDDVHAAIDETLTKGTSTDVLICLAPRSSGDQVRRILKVLQSKPVRTPQGALTRADLYHRLKQDDDARRELPYVCALLRTVAQPSDFESRARRLAQELGDEKLAEQPIEPRVLKELGFIELIPGVQVAPQEIGVEEPVHFYARTSKGSIRTISLRAFKVAATDGDPFQLTFVDAKEHGRSFGSSGTSCGFSLEDNGDRVSFTLSRLGTAERFRLDTLFSRQ
jgi:hypothetical protein